MNCDHDPDVGCSAVKNYPIIRVSEFGTAHGDDQIMAEIYARGPVSAAINANCIETYTGGINMYGKFIWFRQLLNQTRHTLSVELTTLQS